MVEQAAPLAAWPWEWLGTYKYWLYVPLVAKVAYAYHDNTPVVDNWCLHVLIITLFRSLIYVGWSFVSRAEFVCPNLRIQTENVDFEQVDREFDWDNFLILQACVAAAAQSWIPSLGNLPIWDLKGLALVLLIHAGPVELAYYVSHRAFHGSYLFTRYHSFHHASVRVEASSAGTSTFLEHVVMTALMAIPFVVVFYLGLPSIGMFYMYILGYDFLKTMIHSNVEVMPLWPYQLFPLFKYFLITPTYHSAHHSSMKANFCLFLPLYDHLGGTVDKSVYRIHADLRTKGQPKSVPDLVFLAHGPDFMSIVHSGYFQRTFTSVPFKARWYIWFLWPLTWTSVFFVWITQTPYPVSSYRLGNLKQQTYAVPRIGFQYLLPFMFKDINDIIEKAILDFDRKGVKVVALGALNKNEAMNGGGRLFVKKHEDLKVRVCHGNTLTTAVILQELPKDVSEVFLSGATSKIGKAIALYLCRKQVRVMMLTLSKARFNDAVAEAAPEFREYLVQVTKYEEGRNCKTWIVGKWASYGDQKWAPPGTHFHQFTLPEILRFRSDCTYGTLAGLRVPSSVYGISTCEYKMPRRAIHACHAGGLVHCLEGWKDHEVGAIDVDKIDATWDAAVKHGFSMI